LTNWLAGLLSVMLAAFLFGTNTIIINRAYTLGFTPILLLFIQCLLATIMLWFTLGISKPNLLKITKKDILPLLIQGFLGNFITSLCISIALLYVSPAMATILLFTYPTLVFIINFFINKVKVTKLQLLALILCLGGSLTALNIFSTDDNIINPKGIFWGLLSALGYALYHVYSQKVTVNIKPSTAICYNITFATLFSFLFLPNKVAAITSLNWQMILMGLFLALIASILPFFFLVKGISIIGANRASIISTFELPVALGLSYLILGTKLNVIQIFGCIGIILSIFILEVNHTEDDAATIHATRTDN
jgi:drug/metabolite transporter (DMT)-like permease